MRILIVGAGATGGYFGGRLLESGRDVTFLVRPGRAASLARDGLMIRSSTGDVTLPAPPTVLATELHDAYDLVLLSCKAYDLQSVMEDIAPAVGPHSTILPLLNGMRHLDLLDTRFGPQRVLGGQCIIAATLDAAGVIQHLNTSHSLSFGERDGADSERIRTIAQTMADARFTPRASTTILQDMWDKWVFLATLAGITCLMRACVGDIAAAPGGTATTLRLLEDCLGVAEQADHRPNEGVLQRARHMLTEPGSTLTASMLRDLESGRVTEADHVIGDLIERAHGETPLLHIVYAHLKAYEARRAHTLKLP
ncbi:2-dehydropantoate 2-reductase [Dyella tabacisoli]|uniref:2-dehydropantoate 2-reductase n=1 Tax=Dyella tabacisoli TaxID=2282381 RepID=A0A369UUI2_9GAMM|nr:2-dehydropantoate 2-reductase [Dyella tabacisoli]RDD81999.1 2-dehydropantoate 2-reductase [Dyella tabacisoli]